MLGDFEYQILTSIIALRGEAYGSPVKKKIEDSFSRTVSYGALYTTLMRLEKKGLVEFEIGDSTPVRGGRAKKLFTVTGDGQKAISEKMNFLSSAHSSITNGGSYA